MISSAHKKMIGQTYFPGQKGDDYFDRKTSSVDKITIE